MPTKATATSRSRRAAATSGVDLVACRGNMKYAIQAKRYAGSVSRSAVSDAVAAKQPDTCLSIHWASHKDERVALVAHVGRHKTNTKT
jgi:HJR/Mrr/RecB family endonuclease